MSGLRPVLTWVGACAIGVTLAGLGGCFVVIGLDEADRLASVVGSLVGVVGLGLSGYGLLLTRRAPGGPSGEAGSTPRPDGGGVTNTISGGTVHGPVFQGRDVTGPITLGPSADLGRGDPGQRPSTDHEQP